MSRKLPRATTRTLSEISGADAAPAAAAGTPVGPPSPSATAEADHRSELRRVRAQAIVDRHTALSAIGGIVPIPLADTISLMVIVSRMVGALAQHYAMPTKPERSRMIAAAVIAGVAPPVVSGTVISGLARLIPGAPVFAAAATSTAAAALTRALGQAFILHFERGGTLADFDPETVRQHYPAPAGAA